MYVNPFLGGIFTTILCEITIIFIVALIAAWRKM